MKLVIVTGGIASGKSTVVERLASKGVVTISADQVAREVSGEAPGTDAGRNTGPNTAPATRSSPRGRGA